jgi:ribosomal protein L37AE/L43A
MHKYFCPSCGPESSKLLPDNYQIWHCPKCGKIGLCFPVKEEEPKVDMPDFLKDLFK